MADVVPAIDTSTYPKAQLPVTPFGVASDIGALAQRGQQLQSGALQIKQQQLDQANQAYSYLSRAVNALGPNPTPDQVRQAFQGVVDVGLAPQQMANTIQSTVPNDPAQIPGFIQNWRMAAAQHQEMLNWHARNFGVLNTGNAEQPYSTSQTGGFQPEGGPVPTQLPVSTPQLNQIPGPNYGQAGIRGPAPAVVPSGMVPSTAIGSNPLPVAQPPIPTAPQPSAIQPSVLPPTGNNAGPAPIKDQTQAPAGNPPGWTAAGMPPLYTAGMDAYNTDLQNASRIQLQLKPLIQAIPLMDQLNSGPLAGKINTVMASLKQLGIIPTSVNDPTVAYQEVEKKIKQYVGNSPLAGRSDAAQALKEAGTPNPDHQIRPALIELAKDQVVLDRMAAAMPSAFTDPQTGQPRTDFQNYNNFRAPFAQQIDERAFKLDLMSPNDRQNLLDQMKKNANTFAGQKFWRSLQMVKNLNLYNIGGQ